MSLPTTMYFLFLNESERSSSILCQSYSILILIPPFLLLDFDLPPLNFRSIFKSCPEAHPTTSHLGEPLECVHIKFSNWKSLSVRCDIQDLCGHSEHAILRAVLWYDRRCHWCFLYLWSWGWGALMGKELHFLRVGDRVNFYLQSFTIKLQAVDQWLSGLNRIVYGFWQCIHWLYSKATVMVAV